MLFHLLSGVIPSIFYIYYTNLTKKKPTYLDGEDFQWC